MYTVYMHQNKENGKRYFGITSRDVNDRWHNGLGYSDGLPIGRAIKKYGWDNFDHVIVAEGLSEEEAKQMEIELIAKYKTQNDRFGYNICAGGDGVKGWHPSEETRRKISEAQKGRFGSLNPNYGHRWTNEMRQAASERMRANFTEEKKARLSELAKKRTGALNPFYGKRHSDETRAKISQCRKKRVEMFDQSMTSLKIFPSVKSAAEEIGVSTTAISDCCRGKTRSSGGYIWKYVDDKRDLP